MPLEHSTLLQILEFIRTSAAAQIRLYTLMYRTVKSEVWRTTKGLLIDVEFTKSGAFRFEYFFRGELHILYASAASLKIPQH